MRKKYAVYLGMAAILGLAFASNAGAADGPHWTYDTDEQSENGQGKWGGLEDVSQAPPPLNYPYAECGIGTHQSPIDLAVQADENTLDRKKGNHAEQWEDKTNLLDFKYVYDTAPDFIDTGHTVKVNTSANYTGKLYIGNDAYPLIQYHFHTPAEHVIGKKKPYAGELHFVHIRPDGKTAVVGVFLEEGAQDNSAIWTILTNVVQGQGHNQTGLGLNPKSLLPRDKSHFYSYAGSLTTPPCSEGVNWYVLKETLKISSSQLSQLQDLYSGNNRTPQALNGRTVSGNLR